MGPRPAAVFLKVERDGQGLTLRLAQDPEGKERALAHVRGWAVSHVERLLPPALGEVIALAMREVGQGDPVAPWKIAEPVAAALVRAAASRGAWARVSELRRTPARPQWPCWPTGLRSGPAPADGVWPFDAELAGLRAGLRSVIKREARSVADAETDAAWLGAAGLRVRTASGITWAAARDGELDGALADESAIGGRGPEADDAVRRLGQQLGYPACCVERFVALGARDDATLASVLLPRLDERRHDPHTSWVIGALALVSHAPCSLECAATVALGAKLAAALDAERPGFASRWGDLAASIAAVDEDGRAWLLDTARGDDRWRMHVTRAREILPGTASVREAPEHLGRELRVAGGALENADPDGPPWRLPWAADHRGSAG